MVLSDLSAAERSALAAKVGCSAKYLYQCARFWRGKRPSPELARELVAAEPRLTLEGLLFPEDGRCSTPRSEVAVAEQAAA